MAKGKPLFIPEKVRALQTSSFLTPSPLFSLYLSLLHESICHKNMYIYYHRKDKGKVVTLTLAFTYTHISSSINQTNELLQHTLYSSPRLALTWGCGREWVWVWVWSGVCRNEREPNGIKCYKKTVEPRATSHEALQGRHGHESGMESSRDLRRPRAMTCYAHVM